MNTVGILLEYIKCKFWIWTRECNERKTFHSGHMRSNGRKAFIMELGQMSLRDHFEKEADKFSGVQIMKLAKDIALAMRDFHRGNKFIVHD
jgi:hypothetical protein